VIANAETINVGLARRPRRARDGGWAADPDTDLALLSIKLKNLPVMAARALG